MRKTTVYLSDEQAEDLERMAAQSGLSKAQLIREGVKRTAEARGLRPPRPTIPLFSSGDPSLAERVDELLAGDPERGIPAFGED